MLQSEVNAILERKVGDWARENGELVLYDNLKVDPVPDDRPYLRMLVEPGDSIWSGNAHGPEVRRTGMLSIQIFALEDKGWIGATSLVDSLIQHLEYWPRYDSTDRSDARTLTLKQAMPDRVGYENGRYQYNCYFPYSAG